MLRSHTECGVDTHIYLCIIIYLFINYYFIFYNKKTQLLIFILIQYLIFTYIISLIYFNKYNKKKKRLK